VPENGQATTVYFQGAVPALTLEFEGQKAAARYRVRVFRAGVVAEFESLPPEGRIVVHQEGDDRSVSVMRADGSE